ncbi:MAG: MerR family transcriptional regulator [Candidatus Limnocylindria bacterium]
MRIGEMARALGVSSDTVRFYEREGWLPPAGRAENGYRDYRADDLEHLRLLIELRRMDLPLDAAARLASWCHSGHCEDTSAELPLKLADKRREIAVRIDGLRRLDERIAQLERHLARSALASSELQILAAGGPCCSAAAAVTDEEGACCACCATPLPEA